MCNLGNACGTCHASFRRLLTSQLANEVSGWSGKYVKNEYYKDQNQPDKSVDVEIAIKLKEENKAFKVEKYKHSYPNCWRTDKPILYYPLNSWFVKVSSERDRMVALNQQINWKIAHLIALLLKTLRVGI